jgi:hypothetical protein
MHAGDKGDRQGCMTFTSIILHLPGSIPTRKAVNILCSVVREFSQHQEFGPQPAHSSRLMLMIRTAGYPAPFQNGYHHLPGWSYGEYRTDNRSIRFAG